MIDFERYGEPVKTLGKTYLEYYIRADKRTMRVLRRLEKEALKLGDPELTGFVYHSMANVHYYITDNYDAFLKNLKRSATYLLRAENKSEMKHVYYMIAIDAMNRGSLDIAYYYANLAGKIAEESGQEDSARIVDGMLANLLLWMDAFEEAYAYAEKSLDGIRRHPEHPLYRINLIILNTIGGLVLLALSRPGEAAEKYREAMHCLEDFGEAIDPNARLDLRELGLLVALEMGDDATVAERFRLFMKEMEGDIQILDHIMNLRTILEHLLARGATEEAGRLIDLVEKHGLPENMPRAGQIFMEMKTDYHIACGNEAALEKAYEAGQRESRVFSGEQKSSDAYLRELIRLADELQRERERAGRENETIRHRANTDALCNIPNRYALNRHLEQTYERAFREKTRMGVCLLDVDGLKAYNDANGHAAGDACLMRIGEILSQAALSPGVFAARYGGDEFVLVFDNYTDREIRASIARIADAFPISVSAGMYNGIPDDKHRNWDYLARADSDLYKNKRARQL